MLIMAGSVEHEAFSPLEWNAEVLEVKDETPTVRTFRFSRPKAPFSFRPGQYMAVKLDDVADPRGDSRTFSISSSPTDEDHISVTTRLGPSPFKQRLFQINRGEEVNLWAPFGSFVLEDNHPAVLLGGGIGITPFRSMIRFAAAMRLMTPIVLLYSSRIAEEIVYRKELETLAQQWKDFRPVLCVSRPAESRVQWSGRTGHVDADLIREIAASLQDPVYYACGPPSMVQELRQQLTQKLRVPDASVRTELFTGY
jgi:glycine betaine catabolism B